MLKLFKVILKIPEQYKLASFWGPSCYHRTRYINLAFLLVILNKFASIVIFIHFRVLILYCQYIGRQRRIEKENR